MHMCGPRPGDREQSGFSMVEMLMAAFVISIGILGIAMLQVMSLKASRGGQNLGIAVQLAEQLMDKVEMEGRLTYLNSNISGYSTPGALGKTITQPTLNFELKYINQTQVDQYFSIDPATGKPVQLPDATGALFHATMTQAEVGATTDLSDFTIQVVFTDVINPDTQQAITRTATINRRILHG